MHLALVISSLSSGGAERVLSQLANHFISQNHQVSLITLASPKTIPFYPLDPKIQIIQLDQSAADTNFFVRGKNIINRLFSLRKTIKNLAPDGVISFVDIMNITTLIATWGLKIPVIVSERTHPGYYHISCFYNKLRSLFYPKAARVIAQTQSVASHFKTLKNVSVIPNVVSTPTSYKQTNNHIKNIISIGRLCPFKGFDTLIHAFAHLAPSYPALRLTIYGEGQERSNLENLITSLNMQDKIHLPGTTQNVHEALMSSDLFVFPSHYEGFPNALCEAMAAGLPVLASNCSGNVDMVRDGVDGVLFSIGDIPTLTYAIKNLLKNPNECQRLAENARQICERFHADHVLKMWDTLVQNAIKENL